MAATPGLLFRGAAPVTPATVTAGTVYTAPADGPTLVKTITLNNTAGTSSTGVIHIVPAGTAVSTPLPIAANQLYGAATATAATTVALTLTPNVIMNPGDMLTVTGSQAGVTVFISGVEHLGNAPGVESLNY